MRHVLFGQSGLRVSELCLGAMVFGDARELGASRKDSQEVFEAFAAAGGSFIDTADHYADGESERLVGEFVASDRDSFVISTKWSVARHGGLQRSGNGRRNMMRAVEASLRRLKTDRIDLYSLHAWDYATPCEEIMRGLDDLVRGGKVHYVAISDTPAWEVSRAKAAHQPAGRRSGSPIPDGTMRIAAEVGSIAALMGASPAQVALAWVRQQQAAVPVIPIIGARTKAQLESNLQSLSVQLDDSALGRLDKVSAIELGFPHDFLRTDYVRALLHGGEPDRLTLRQPLPHPVSDLAMGSGVTKK
ncbi:MAG: aldo/keto reductase [Betaproteobacteria bacterium]|nr:aldo/keto reductase [Betaproteobacteria bacterium]